MCICERKPEYTKKDGINFFDKYMNAKLIAWDGYTAAKVYLGVRPAGDVYIWSETRNGEHIEYYPAFCPECGRKLEFKGDIL